MTIGDSQVVRQLRDTLHLLLSREAVGWPSVGTELIGILVYCVCGR